MSCVTEGEFVDLYLNNDHTIFVDNLRGYIAGVLTQLNGATISFEFFDLENTAIADSTGTLTAVGSGGDYTGEVDATIANLLDEGSEYYLRLIGEQSGADFEFNIPVRVRRRGKT